MNIEQPSGAGLLAQRDEFEAMMLAADARAYELVGSGLDVRLIDFPLSPGEVSYVWTGYGSTPDGPEDGWDASVTVATAAIGQLNDLRSRLRLDDAPIERAGSHVTLEGQSEIQEKALTILESQRAYVEFIDDDVVVVISARSIDDLPDFDAVRPLRDLQPMIDRWKGL